MEICDFPYWIEKLHDAPVDPERLKWFRARDLLLGFNGKIRDIKMALRIAKKCSWHEAKLLVSYCGDCDMSDSNYHDPSSIKNKLISSGSGFAMGLASLFSPLNPESTSATLAEAALAGDAFAQAMSYKRSINIKDDATKNMLLQSIKQDEPYGWLYLGGTYMRGHSVATILVRNRETAIKCLNRAISLGIITAYQYMGDLFRVVDPEFYFWTGKYSIISSRSQDFISALRALKIRWNNSKSYPAIYQAGKSLQGNINNESMTVFGIRQPNVTYYNDAIWAVELFNKWRDESKKSVFAWTVVSRKTGCNRDIRKLVGEAIWARRKNGNII